MKVKNYIAAWSDNYQLIFQKSRLLSQIPIFIIAVVWFCESIEPFTRGALPGEEPDWIYILKYSVFSLLIVFIFVFRFLLLFSKSKSKFFASQFLWILSFLWFLYYFSQPHGGCPKTFEAIMIFYFIGSSIRQIISLFLSFFPN